MSGAEGKPVLLTEREWANLIGLSAYSKASATLRERGLIAPEPVDPLLVEAREVCARDSEAGGWGLAAKEYRDGQRDEAVPIRLTLAALRRGMDLAPAARLTREIVREAAKVALRSCTRMLSASDFESAALDDDKRNIEAFVNRLHTALTQQMEGRDG